MRQPIGQFLLRRLEEVGIRQVFGVPGDYNLTLLQELEDAGRLQWIGTCNELNAAYAADGYARIRGLSALLTTNGVGVLSALNGIAGSFSEHVPVISICGTVPQSSLDRGQFMHHTMADHSPERFSRVLAEVTAAQAHLTPENAAIEIDRLIMTAWRRKLPVHLELPSDISGLVIEVPEKPLTLADPVSDPESLQICVQKILARLQQAKRPALLLGPDANRFRVLDQIRAIAEKLQAPVAVMSAAKGDFPETSPLFAGMYSGAASDLKTKNAIEQSDCLLSIGFRRVDYICGFFSDQLPPNTIHLSGHSAEVGQEDIQGVFLRELLDRLTKEVPMGPRLTKPFSDPKEAAPSTPNQQPLTQDDHWKAIQRFIKPGDLLVAESGTSAAGVGGLVLPPDTTLVSQTIWGSIGFSVGCLLGTLLAAPSRRQILMVGDGSFQLTAQEVSTMLRHNLKPYIILINNAGYTVEKTILGCNADYNKIANWRYTELVKTFSRTQEVVTYIVKTSEDLELALFSPHREKMVFIEVVMDPDDAPASLIRFGHSAAKLEYGSRGPQCGKGAQIPERS